MTPPEKEFTRVLKGGNMGEEEQVTASTGRKEKVPPLAWVWSCFDFSAVLVGKAYCGTRYNPVSVGCRGSAHNEADAINTVALSWSNARVREALEEAALIADAEDATGFTGNQIRALKESFQ